MHFQETTITQYKPAISAKYSGDNSLITDEETETTITSTLYLGIRLGKNTSFYFNPELSGGSGLSGAKGIAGFTNGEAFRVGDAAPRIYLARAFIKQIFPLSKETESVADDANQLSGTIPKAYISFQIGKFCMADYFDANKYSHDPRVQFFNWSLMSNGAWDYPANVRGYTWGYVAELVKPNFSVRISSSLVPTVANGPDLNWNIGKNISHTAEIEKPYRFLGKNGIVRLLGFYTETYMGNYLLAAAQPSPDITTTREDGRTKTGFGLNIEQDLTENAGLFFRSSWNDGKNETWAFTEIDNSVSLGFATTLAKWKRPFDTFGAAIAINGISAEHQTYLKSGGYGFIIGDGNLNYDTEKIFETYYNLHLHEQHFWIAPNYQFIVNPAFNKDRGSVHVFGIRVHTEF